MSKWENISFSNENRVRLNELIRIVNYASSKGFKTYRFVGDPQKIAQVWLPIYKDGKPVISQKGKPVNIPFNITNFNPETETFDETKECPFVKASELIRKHIKDDKVANQFKPQVAVMAQAISRSLQENPDKKGKPSKKERQTGFKESFDSDSYTPVECHQINFAIGQGLESVKETNTVVIKGKDGTKKKAHKTVADPKYGRDVQIKYDPNAQGVSKYKVQGGDRTPLNEGDYEGEDKYLLWDIVSAIKETTMTPKEAKVEADRIVKEFLKSVKKKSSSDDDDDDDDDLPDDIEGDDDEDTKSSKKSNKKKTANKKKPKDEDEDGDDDDDSDLEDDDDADDEEEEKPAKKKSSKATKKPVKKADKKKSSGKKKSDDDDDDDSDDDDDDSDDDDDDDIDLDLDDDDD